MRERLRRIHLVLRWSAVGLLCLFVIQAASSFTSHMLLTAQIQASTSSDHPMLLEGYDAGLFRSEAYLSLGLGDARSGIALVRAEIAHGPWLPTRACGGGFGLLLARGEILPTVDTPRLGHYFDTDDPPRFCISLSAGGASHAVLEVPAYSGPMYDPREAGSKLALGWDAFRLDLEVDGEGWMEARLQLPRLNTEALTPTSRPDAYGWRRYLERYRDFIGVTARFTRQPDRDTGELIHRSWDIALGVHEFRSERVHGQESDARVVHRGRLELSGQSEGPRLDLDGRLAWASLAMHGRFVEAGSLDVSLAGLDGQALRDLITVLDTVDLALPDEESTRVVRGTLAHYLPRVIAPGPRISLGPFRQALPEGELSFLARLDLPAGAAELDPRELAGALRGRLHLGLPRPILLQALTEISEVAAARNEEGRGERERWYRARARAHEAMDRLRSRGFIRERDPDQIETELSLQGGEWLLNGHSVGRGLDGVGPMLGLEPEPPLLAPPDDNQT